MAMTLSEQIMAVKCGQSMVRPGEIHDMDIDLVMVTDVMFPLVLDALDEMGCRRAFDPDKVVVVLDHFVPAPNIKAANQNRLGREGAARFGFKLEENVGVCHMILPEKGYVKPGMMVIGSDSHTTTYGALGVFSTGLGVTDIAVAIATGKLWMKVPETIRVVLEGTLPDHITGKDIILEIIGELGVSGAIYKALEISGEAVKTLSLDDRLTMCNMAIECGAKNCIVQPDEKAEAFLEGRVDEINWSFESTEGATYERTLTVDLTDMVPRVACPSLPDRVKDAEELVGTPVDQVYIGSCTNGRLSDLAKVARILEGKTIAPSVRLIVTPGSQEVTLEAMRLGYLETIIKAGGFVNGPSCGACFGGHFGVIGDGEVCLSTTNRNFVGRMGSQKGQIYLASPIVAAHTALTGTITTPGGGQNEV